MLRQLFSREIIGYMPSPEKQN